MQFRASQTMRPRRGFPESCDAGATHTLSSGSNRPRKDYNCFKSIKLRETTEVMITLHESFEQTVPIAACHKREVETGLSMGDIYHERLKRLHA